MKIATYKGRISEWDMVSANISVLIESNMISMETYTDLRDTDKEDRNVTVGMLMRDYKECDLPTVVADLIKKYVDMFIETNHIRDKEVLEIAKDAIFLHNITPKITKFGDYINFIEKHTYYFVIEFELKNASQKVKLYKSADGVSCRGGKLNIEHVAYRTLNMLMSDIYNKNSKGYIRVLNLMIDQLKSSDQLISTVDNKYLIDVVRNVFTLI